MTELLLKGGALALAVGFLLAVNYALALAGEPRAVWLMNMLGWL